MFVTTDGTFVANPLTGNDYHILLVHPGLSDALVLHHFPEGTTTPYVRGQTGWPQATDRNPKGILPTQGSLDRVATEFQATFIATEDQCGLFDTLLAAQNIGSVVTLIDHFHGRLDSIPVWIQVDQSYRTPYAIGVWWVLQFRALEDS